MYILGINAAFHDTAACILKDGVLLAAAEEERFTRIKHGKRPVPFSAWQLPYHAINYCLEIAGIPLKEVDQIAYSFKPDLFLKIDANAENVSIPLNSENQEKEPGESPWDALFYNYIINAPKHLTDGFPHHLQKNFLDAHNTRDKWIFVDHHIAHAASAYYPSPFNRAAVWVIDGRGEKASTSYYKAQGESMELIGQVNMPHSLGILYENVTTWLGFLHSSDEYKVMALASYGKPEYVDFFRSKIHIGENGNYTIKDLGLEDKIGPARKRSEPFEELHFNVAHSLQKVLEETMLSLAGWLHEATGSDNLAMAGGVALNCVMNAVLRDKGPFKNIWVQPAAGDAGTALGAALWIYFQSREAEKVRFKMDHVYWGPGFDDQEIEKFLKWSKVPYLEVANPAAEAARLLADDKIIGWFQGKMEFGPRALGSRSILASPISPDMQQRLNEIKDREDFRPVAPVVREEDAPDWFEGADYSPFMLFVYNIKAGKEDKIPAVRHTDNTARVQTVNRQQNQPYYDLLTEFKKLTGVPVLVNTSFNTRGEPIVCTPRDAIECFWTSPFDALVINSFLLTKKPFDDEDLNRYSDIQSTELAEQVS